MQKYRFCPLCATGLSELSNIGGLDRKTCPGCGWIDYRNPVPVACALVPDFDDRILLVERSIPPSKGEWALPGGFIEMGEDAVEAAKRELREETGLSAFPLGIVGIQKQASRNYGNVIIIGIAFKAVRRKPRAGDDASDARFFRNDELPHIPFDSHTELIREYLRQKNFKVNVNCQTEKGSQWNDPA